MSTQRGFLHHLRCAVILLTPALATAQHELSLRQAVLIALSQHPQMEAARAAHSAAADRVREARASYWPKLHYQESIARSNNPVFVFGSLLSQHQFTQDRFAIDVLNRPDFLNNFQSVITAEQLLFDPSRGHHLEAARLNRQLAEQSERLARTRFVAEVARRYYAVLVAEQAQRVANEARRSAEMDLKRAENLREAGLITDADVLSLQVHLAAMREQEIQAAAQLQVAWAALNEALGRPFDERYQLTTELTPLELPEESLLEYESAAETQRPEVLQARLANGLARAQHGIARASRWPQVWARAVFEADRQEFYRKGGANGYVAVGLRWNLFDGFAREARHSAARWELVAARLTERSTVNRARLEVREAYARLRAATERIAVARASISQAQESQRITANRYEAGLATVTDLLRVETALLESRLRYLQALYEQRLAAITLELASGRLSESSRVLD